MPDFKYRIAGVYHTVAHKACRFAVLTPLVNWRTKKADKVDSCIRLALFRLRGLWCSRLREFQAADWEVLNSALRVQYMRNCPPFGVITNTRGHCCRRNVVCPFCYARSMVLETYKRLETFVWGEEKVDPDTGDYKKAPEEYRLAEWCLRSLVPREEDWTLDRLQRDILPRVLDLLRRGRHSELTKLKPYRAATVFFRLEVLEEGLVIHRSGLAVVSHDVPGTLKPWGVADKNFQQRVHEVFSRTTLAGACGRVLRYPASYLTGPNVPEIVTVLHGLKRFRTIAHYGTRAAPKNYF